MTSSLLHSSVPHSANFAVLGATVGLLLLFLECNGPGRIFPGTFGLLLTLLATARLLHLGIRPWAAALLLCVAGTFLSNVWLHLPAPLLAAASVAGVVGLRFLVAAGAPSAVHLGLALVCAGLLCSSAGVLTRIAYRARCAKALN